MRSGRARNSSINGGPTGCRTGTATSSKNEEDDVADDKDPVEIAATAQGPRVNVVDENDKLDGVCGAFLANPPAPGRGPAARGFHGDIKELELEELELEELEEFEEELELVVKSPVPENDDPITPNDELVPPPTYCLRYADPCIPPDADWCCWDPPKVPTALPDKLEALRWDLLNEEDEVPDC